MARVYNLKALANTLINMLPTLSMIFVIVIEVGILGNTLSVTKIFSIVSIISNFYGPLANLVQIMDSYNEYKYAIRSFGLFLFGLEDTPNKDYPEEKKGDVEFKECVFERVDEVDMFRGVQKIFGEHLKMLGKPKFLKALPEETQNTNGQGKIEGSNRYQTIQNVQSIKKNLTAQTTGKDGLKSGRLVKRRIAQQRLTLEVKSGDKICLVGSDKRAQKDFFYTLSKETYLVSGHFYMGGKISFCNCEEVTIQGGKTVRENILFGSKMNWDRYNAVVEAVGLVFEDFTRGDRSNVTREGRNLSYYEIRKVLLARCVYQEADIYLIHNYYGVRDDEAEKMCFSKVVKGLLKDKTVFYESNSDLLQASATILVEPRATRVNIVKELPKPKMEKQVTMKNGKGNLARSTKDRVKAKIKGALLAETMSFNRSKHGKKQNDIRKLMLQKIAESKKAVS